MSAVHARRDVVRQRRRARIPPIHARFLSCQILTVSRRILTESTSLRPKHTSGLPVWLSHQTAVSSLHELEREVHDVFRNESYGGPERGSGAKAALGRRGTSGAAHAGRRSVRRPAGGSMFAL